MQGPTISLSNPDGDQDCTVEWVKCQGDEELGDRNIDVLIRVLRGGKRSMQGSKEHTRNQGKFRYQRFLMDEVTLLLESFSQTIAPVKHKCAFSVKRCTLTISN